MKNLIQKTSRKPKKTKNNNIPGLLEKEKCKNQKNLEKTKKKQYSRTLVCRPHLQTSGILFFLFFLVFSRFFWFLHFSFSKSPGILFFFGGGFFGFLEVFLIFAFFLFQESWNIVFFCFFWLNRLFFLFFFGFLEVFWIFAFLLLQESWNIVFFSFFVFFWFSRGFWDFCFCKSPGILFFFGFFGFLEVFWIFFMT